MHPLPEKDDSEIQTDCKHSRCRNGATHAVTGTPNSSDDAMSSDGSVVTEGDSPIMLDRILAIPLSTAESPNNRSDQTVSIPSGNSGSTVRTTACVFQPHGPRRTRASRVAAADVILLSATDKSRNWVKARSVSQRMRAPATPKPLLRKLRLVKLG